MTKKKKKGTGVLKPTHTLSMHTSTRHGVLPFFFSIGLSVTPVNIDFLPQDDIKGKKQGNLIMKKSCFKVKKVLLFMT
jgi:hypothetical protein